MDAPMTHAADRERADRREGLRLRLHLRLAIVYPEHDGRPVQPIYHAETHDICISGLSMVVDDNVFHEGAVNVQLTLPPVHPWASQEIVTATAIMTYAIHSSKLNAFKIGMKLLGFKADGKERLQAALRSAAKKDADAGMQDPGVQSGALRIAVSQPLGR